MSGHLAHFSLVGLLAGALTGVLVEDLGIASLISFWGDLGPFVAALAITGAAAWNTRARNIVSSVATALLMLWAIVAFTPLSRWLAKDLPRRDPAAPSDAIYVSVAGIQDDGELTAIAFSRFMHGIELLAEGLAPALVVSNLRAPSPPYTPSVRALLDRLRVSGQLVIVGSAGNTHEEAAAVAALCRERGWRRILLVTSPYHSRRAAAALEHEGVETISSPSVETDFDAETLRRTRDRRRAFGSLIHEWVGLWIYRRRGWIAESDERR
ncbi:MAG: YdcF family protein [Candidatus Binatia bacterium]